eukprot:tig00020927_g16000.t1
MAPGRGLFEPADGRPTRVLLVVAHPDDECMFFTPTLLALRESGADVHALCLSTGNAAGLGRTRAEEMAKSCASFGICEDRASVVDDPCLQDGPRENWDHDHIADVVAEHVRRWGINKLVTFDPYGVSGHPNHGAACRGVRRFAARERSSGRAVQAYELESVGLLRKYIGPLDVPLHAALAALGVRRAAGEEMAVALRAGPAAALRAMRCHASQLVWFRRLFVVFSRFVYLNVLRPA